MTKVHIFDIDGTVLDSMRMWDNLSSLYLKSIGIEPPANLADILDPLTYPEALDYLVTNFDIEGGIDAVEEGMNTVLADQYENKLELFDDILDYLEELHNNGERMVVFSNTPHVFLDRALERTGIIKMFDRIISVEDIGIRKDCADSFTLVCELLGVDVSEVLVHEDSVYAIDAAKAAGCKVKVYDRYR